MKIYFGIWRIIIGLSTPVKIFIELFIILSIIYILFPIIKYVLWLLIKMLSVLNIVINIGIRFLLLIFPGEKMCICKFDDSVGRCGYKIDTWLKRQGDNFVELKVRKYFKEKHASKKYVWAIISIIYIMAILPSFHLEKFVSEYYLKDMYCINIFFNNVEQYMTRGKENYPDLFVKPKKMEVVKVAEQEEIVYLELGEGISYANLRQAPNLESKKMNTLSRDDIIIYKNRYVNDEERYWLRVSIVSQNNMEGWISGKVLSEESIDILDFQK